MQDIYQQLQDLCNRQIEKGLRKPWGNETFEGLVITEGGIIAQRGDDDYLPLDMRMHDIFSADSGFMESLEWKNNDNKLVLHTKTKDDVFGFIKTDEPIQMLKYHYMLMGPMTAEEKIQYVLQNTVQPDE